MPYLLSIQLNTERTHPYPFDIPAVKHAKAIDLTNPVTFLIGENGSGKSTLLETLAFRLQLPHMDGIGYEKKCFDAARRLTPFLEVNWAISGLTAFSLERKILGITSIVCIDRMQICITKCWSCRVKCRKTLFKK